MCAVYWICLCLLAIAVLEARHILICQVVWSLISFVGVFDFFGVVILVCDYGRSHDFQVFLFSIGCFLLLRFDVFVCRAVVLYASLSWLWPWFVHGRLQCQIRCVYSVFEQVWSSGAGMWLFPTLVCHCWSICFVIFVRIMVFHIAVKVLVMLYESPRWSPG